MNPITRNTLFSALLSFAGTLAASSQSNNTTVGTLSRINPENAIKAEELKSIEISREVAMPKNGEIYIENTSSNIVVKCWDQQKVKINTTVFYEGDGKLTDEEWLERSNLSLRTLGTAVKIKSGSANGYTYYNQGLLTGSASLYNSGQNSSSKNNIKKTIIITVPTGSKLDIESKYANVQLPANLGDVNVDILNGNLEGDNFDKLILRTKYANVNIGDVKTAEVEFMNGRFSAKTIDDLDIDSKNSTIEMAAVKKIVLRSTNDEYELEEVGEVRGRKNYGNLRITRLNTLLDLEGANADVKIRNIAASVNLIKIDNRYADIRIPLKNTKNYSVDFAGAYSSVYGNFEKQALAVKDDENQLRNTNATLSSINDAERKPTLASIGSLTNLTVTGVLTPGNGSAVNGTVVYDNNRKPSITSVGTLTSLTVTGFETPPAYTNYSNTNRGTLSAVTVPGANIGGTLGYTGSLAGSVSGATFTPYNRNFSYAVFNGTPSKFTATVGNGKDLKIDIKCQSCTVDFK